MFIVIVGDPVSGLQFFGPFATGCEATEWADFNVQEAWWITNVAEPAAYTNS